MYKSPYLHKDMVVNVETWKQKASVIGNNLFFYICLRNLHTFDIIVDQIELSGYMCETVALRSGFRPECFQSKQKISI